MKEIGESGNKLGEKEEWKRRYRERKGRGRVRLSVVVTKYLIVKIKLFFLDNFFYYLVTLNIKLFKVNTVNKEMQNTGFNIII